MRYDPTLKALFFPEKGAPVEDFSTNWTLDQVCAELSRLAYVRFERKSRPKLEAVLAQAGFAGKPACFHSRWTGAQGFGTVAPDGTVFVAFRGTQITSLRDIFADIAAPPLRWAGDGRVHWGFWNSYRSVRKEVDAWVKSVGGPRLVATGHSLGAAMATLMAALHDQAELVTFGSPRVGNRAFADLFAARPVRRYVDCVDGVPRLPPPIGYVHLGEMSYIDHRGAVHSPPPAAAAIREDRRAGRRLYRRKHAWRPGNVPTRSGADHAPVNYVSALLGRRDAP
jgi:pimeloyl-ACP methyl ester carboxylesterase